MKILYAIQGTGNGHISRAIEIIPYLKEKGDVDLLVSGMHSELKLPYEVKYQFKGLGFVFATDGGIDLLNTYLKNKILRFVKEIKKLPVEEYDLVITDFEPVSAWACFLKNRFCIGLSNQAGIMSEKAPNIRKTDPLGKMILKNYCPVTTSYGIHFTKYADNIYTPIIRSDIRKLSTSDDGFYVVYLPSYNDSRIIKTLNKIKQARWIVFSKHFKGSYNEENIEIWPLSKVHFEESLAKCSGVLCNAGFGTPSEALYLGKKLMVIPMKGQYEQQCNALALKQLGVPFIKSLRKKHSHRIESWVENGESLKVDYPDETKKIVDNIINNYKMSHDEVKPDDAIIKSVINKLRKIK